MMRPFHWLFIVLICGGLSGCNRDSGLRGNWAFDRPYTEAHQPKEPEKKPGKTSSMADFAASMKPALTAMVVPMLIQQLDGARLTITRKEMIWTVNGNGGSQSYEVLDRPTPNSWRIKNSDGKVETYSREGEYLCTPATGNLQCTLYFKPLPAGK